MRRKRIYSPLEKYYNIASVKKDGFLIICEYFWNESRQPSRKAKA